MDTTLDAPIYNSVFPIMFVATQMGDIHVAARVRYGHRKLADSLADHINTGKHVVGIYYWDNTAQNYCHITHHTTFDHMTYGDPQHATVLVHTRT
jgi:hypothetical protein